MIQTFKCKHLLYYISNNKINVYGGEKMKKEIKLLDIVIGGFFTLIIVISIYLLFERLHIVPLICFYSDLPASTDGTIRYISSAESIIIMIIVFELSWIFANVLYYKIRRFDFLW